MGVFIAYSNTEYTTKLINIIIHECVLPSTNMIGTWIPRGGREGEGCNVKTTQSLFGTWLSDVDYTLVASVPVAARATDCRVLSLWAGLAISAMPAITRPWGRMEGNMSARLEEEYSDSKELKLTHLNVGAQKCIVFGPKITKEVVLV